MDEQQRAQLETILNEIEAEDPRVSYEKIKEDPYEYHITKKSDSSVILILKNSHENDAYSGDGWDGLGIYLSNGNQFTSCAYAELFNEHAKTRIQKVTNHVFDPPQFHYTEPTPEYQRQQEERYRVLRESLQQVKCLRNGIEAFAAEYTGNPINNKTYQFKIGMITTTAGGHYTSGVEVRIQYQ